jgi:TPR repeat protein
VLVLFCLFGTTPCDGRAQGPDAAGIEELHQRSLSGDVLAITLLGNCYANGTGVTQSDVEAVRLYQKGADNFFAPALFNMGMMQESGRGGARDIAAAFKNYRKAAEVGFAPAQVRAGYLILLAQGTQRDELDAAMWFRLAAEQGNTEAQFQTGLAYDLGRGLGRDEVKARKWYELAAKEGHPGANHNLALLLDAGRGASIDESSALSYYQTAAASGFMPAQCNLGILFIEGRERIPPNLAEGMAWLSLAESNGAEAGLRAAAGTSLPAHQARTDARLSEIRTLPRETRAAQSPPNEKAVNAELHSSLSAKSFGLKPTSR